MEVILALFGTNKPFEAKKRGDSNVRRKRRSTKAEGDGPGRLDFGIKPNKTEDLGAFSSDQNFWILSLVLTQGLPSRTTGTSLHPLRPDPPCSVGWEIPNLSPTTIERIPGPRAKGLTLGSVS